MHLHKYFSEESDEKISHHCTMCGWELTFVREDQIEISDNG